MGQVTGEGAVEEVYLDRAGVVLLSIVRSRHFTSDHDQHKSSFFHRLLLYLLFHRPLVRLPVPPQELLLRLARVLSFSCSSVAIATSKSSRCWLSRRLFPRPRPLSPLPRPMPPLPRIRFETPRRRWVRPWKIRAVGLAASASCCSARTRSCSSTNRCRI